MNNPGPRIAEGATAELFAWGDDAILKLYRTGFPPEEARREAQRIAAVRAAGVSTPGVLDQIDLWRRTGLILERVRGRVMLDALLAEPERAAALAQQMAALHADLHARSAPQLPRQHDRLRYQIERAPSASPAVRAAAIAKLEQLRPGSALCHGDFHPNNILLTPAGPVIIDWVDASQGAPAADVARTRLLTQQSTLPDTMDESTRQQIEHVRQHFFDQYLHSYRSLRALDMDEMAQWELPLAAARLSETLSDAKRRALEEFCTALLK